MVHKVELPIYLGFSYDIKIDECHKSPKATKNETGEAGLFCCKCGNVTAPLTTEFDPRRSRCLRCNHTPDMFYGKCCCRFVGILLPHNAQAGELYGDDKRPYALRTHFWECKTCGEWEKNIIWEAEFNQTRCNTDGCSEYFTEQSMTLNAYGERLGTYDGKRFAKWGPWHSSWQARKEFFNV